MKTTTLRVMAVLLMGVGTLGAYANPAHEEETWDLPKTGQTTSYGTGSDGDLEMGVAWENDTRFELVVSQVLIDHLTGLMWAQSPEIATQTWTQAIDYANASTHADFTDWRLPNLRELRSLIHYGRDTVTWLRGVGFVNLQPAAYWTSTTYYASTSQAWYVHLTEGTLSRGSKSSAYYVILVR
ncbi:MAG: DUF1566 domain-containing protein [Spirochaetales bacterium]|nr:DUF1566 domain-containing protein [Spirochaetales bacterium]